MAKVNYFNLLLGSGVIIAGIIGKFFAGDTYFDGLMAGLLSMLAAYFFLGILVEENEVNQ